jgi:serine/threonine protein kinase
VHRDVKPGNVHLCGGGRVVLTDFGIASAIDDAAPAADSFPGTPAYVSPEQLDGGDTGPACDLFSLGATLFTAVEGRPPFDRARCSPRSPLSCWTGRHRSCAPARCARSSKGCSPRTPDSG